MGTASKPLQQKMQIAVLQTAFLGDTLLSIPLLKRLAQRGERVALICREGYGALFLATGYVEKVFEIEKGSQRSYSDALQGLNIWWTKAETRVLLSPHESFRSKIFALRLRMSGVVTIGFSRWVYTHGVKRPMPLPEALRQLALLSVDPFDDKNLWRTRLKEFSMFQELPGGRTRSGDILPVPDWASMRVAGLENINREQLAVLTPGSVWKTKQWTEPGFVEVGKRFLAQGRQVIISGTADEAELCESIATQIGGGAKSTAGDLSLLETARLIAKAEIAIVNDSGAMHLAAAVETPLVAVFGPTVLDFGYRPWSNTSRVVEPHQKLACRPCGLHGAQICPIGTHVCMTMTDANRVWQAVLTLIKQFRS